MRALAVTAALLLPLVTGCLKEERTPIDFRLPPDFEGGFAVLYKVQGAPPLPMKDGRLQIEVPAEKDPIIETSSSPSGGWARDRYHMAGQVLSPKLVHHSVIASVSDACLFEHAVIGHRMQADAHLQAIVAKLKARCAM